METVTTLKVHRICPLDLLVKVGWRQGVELWEVKKIRSLDMGC
jgi:hypothetical protein